MEPDLVLLGAGFVADEGGFCDVCGYDCDPDCEGRLSYAWTLHDDTDELEIFCTACALALLISLGHTQGACYG